MASNKDIPIVEVSTFSHEDMPMHVKMGEALAPLRYKKNHKESCYMCIENDCLSNKGSQIYKNFRDEGIVIIGSGSSVHNLRLLWSNMDKPSPQWVIDFDKDMEKAACGSIGEERNNAANQLSKHKAFRESHPTAEVQ